MEYSASKKVRLQPDIVEYNPGNQAPYDLIIGKQTLHDLRIVLDFKKKTVQIDKILLPMRNIANLQFKPDITRALRLNTCLAQEPITSEGQIFDLAKCIVLSTRYEYSIQYIVSYNTIH